VCHVRATGVFVRVVKRSKGVMDVDSGGRAVCAPCPVWKNVFPGGRPQYLDMLHKHHISHCDSKLENFLIDENYDLKICDFEGSHYHKGPSPSVVVQPARYRRPIDDFNEVVFNPADDIFAFGSICYEIMAGGPVFPD
jgi:serine/threonine protein kinase